MMKLSAYMRAKNVFLILDDMWRSFNLGRCINHDQAGFVFQNLKMTEQVGRVHENRTFF